MLKQSLTNWGRGIRTYNSAPLYFLILYVLTWRDFWLLGSSAVKVFYGEWLLTVFTLHIQQTWRNIRIHLEFLLFNNLFSPLCCLVLSRRHAVGFCSFNAERSGLLRLERRKAAGYKTKNNGLKAAKMLRRAKQNCRVGYSFSVVSSPDLNPLTCRPAI